jgi:taurine--2-oxoglutarate transaminase
MTNPTLPDRHLLNDPSWIQDAHVDHYIQSWSVQGARPKVITGASGSWYWDSDGKRYLVF